MGSFRFTQTWKVRPPRQYVTDPSTGNRRPGLRPAAVEFLGEDAERFPQTMQTEIAATVAVDEKLLLLEPKAAASGIGLAHQLVDPDGVVWSVVRIPRARRRRGRWSGRVRYVLLIIRRSTDIKES